MIILRYFIDFKDTGKMIFEIVNGRKYNNNNQNMI